MKTLLTLSFCLGFCALLFGQRPRYNCYQKFIKEGQDTAEKAEKNAKLYKIALQKFNAARRCDPSKSDSVDIEIDKLFTQIIALKRKADKSEEKAKNTAKKLESKNEEVQRTLTKVEEEQTKNKKIIDAFYFYHDSLALAVKQDSLRRYKYGFINKNGEAVIGYEYDDASCFSPIDGFARVKQNNIFYLMDSKGKKYQLARDISELKIGVRALDLTGKNLELIPDSIFKYDSLKILLLGKNNLKIFSNNILRLKELIYLDLSYNRSLKNVPAYINDLKKLKLIDFRGIPLNTNERQVIRKKFLNGQTILFQDYVYIPQKLKDLISHVHQDSLLAKIKICKQLVDTLKVYYKEIGNDVMNNFRLSEAYLKLSHYYLIIGQFKDAEEASYEGLKRVNLIPELRINLAHALLFQNNFDEAKKEYNNYIKSNGFKRLSDDFDLFINRNIEVEKVEKIKNYFNFYSK